MARPLAWTLPPRDPRVELLARVNEAPSEHAEALLAAFDVLQGLHDRGVLELLRGALGSGDKVLQIGDDAARSPASIRSLRNLLLLVELVGALDPERLGRVTRAVPQALNAAGSVKPPSFLKLATSIWNKNVRRGMWLGTMLLEAIGRSIGDDSSETRKANES